MTRASSDRKPFTVFVLVASALIAALVLGLASGAAIVQREANAASIGPSDPPSHLPTATVQTWPYAYDATMCADWGTRMTEDQRWVAARQLLAGLRYDAPEHMKTRTVAEFEDDLASGCAGDGKGPLRTSIAWAAYEVYITNPVYAHN